MILIGSNQPRPGSTKPNAAAQLAASQAFLANRASNANLSASAAATALRSHTTSPTPVGQIQTKRMQRRGSVSSNGSAPARPGGLQRRDSGASMTERTFREPSPNRPERPASSHGPYPRYEEAAPPPVPILPQRYASPSLSNKSRQRPASAEPQERISSHPPRLQGGRGISLDREPGVLPIPRGTQQTPSSLDTVNEANQAANRASVNFSRPMSPQNMSPVNSPMHGGRIKSPLPPSDTNAGLPAGEAERILGTPKGTAAHPIKKNKKTVLKESAEGSDLVTMISGGRSQPPASSGTFPQQPKDSHSTVNVAPETDNGTTLAPSRMKKKKKVTKAAEAQQQEPNEGFGNAYPSDTDSVTSEISSTTDRPRSFNTRAAGILAKQPSIVREDREGEEKAERKPSSTKTLAQASPNGSASGRLSIGSKSVSEERQHNRSASQSDAQQSMAISLDVPSTARPTSLSPVRAAHFSTQPIYETPDGAKHQPPARSVSPAKSALKNSPSRGHSPIIRRSKVLTSSEASDTASGISEDTNPPTRKKNKARVSFDEDSVNIGRAASPVSTDSPVILSPQSKPKARSWLDLVRDKTSVADQPGHDQEDTSITPTPALPSFGSVRARNEKNAPQKAIGDIGENNAEKAGSSSMGPSTDESVRENVYQDAAFEGDGCLPAQVHRPLEDASLPDIIPIEGAGFQSDEGNIPQEMKPSVASAPLADAAVPSQENPSIEGVTSLEHNTGHPQIKESDGLMPSIAVMPATPGAEEGLGTHDEWLGMPGEFPGAAEPPSQEQTSMATISEPAPSHPTKVTPATKNSGLDISSSVPSSPIITPATVGIAEPEPEGLLAQLDPNVPCVGDVATTLRTQIESQHGEDSEEHGSIYSDAAEDQTDFEGDGFGSINAIIESPSSPDFGAAGKPPPASPTPNAFNEAVERRKPERTVTQTSEPASDEGWDRAQAYWSGLSHTRKQQLEQAALPGALDEPIIPDRTMRGKNSVARKKKKKGERTTLPVDHMDSVNTGPQSGNSAARSASFIGPDINKPKLSPPQSTLPEPHVRGSIRDGPALKTAEKGSTQRRSVQKGPPEQKATLQKKTRPVSAVPMVDYNESQATSSKTHARAVSAIGSTTSSAHGLAQLKKETSKPKVKLSHARSDGSDSDSSFKRIRSSTPDAGIYKMKRTMRRGGGDVEPSASANRASSINSPKALPAGSTARRPFGSVGGGGGGSMRTSMRDPTDSSKPSRTSMRNSIDSSKAGRTKSPSRFAFSLGSKSKPAESKPRSSYGSRFGDSSDDEIALPPMSSSRFADSSDEDGPALAPVRGIPRRIDEGDSTDLEDSSAENVQARTSGKSNSTVPTTVSAPSTKPEGLALASGSVRAPRGDIASTISMGAGLQAKKAAEKEKKKRSFFGTLGSRRKDDPSRVRKSEIESAARRDTPLERTKAERAVSNQSTMVETTPQSVKFPVQASIVPSTPKSPKLQRRNTPKKLTTAGDISWPLPQVPGNVTVSTPASRPRTSDGAVPSISESRPHMGSRRITVQGATVPNSTTNVAIGRGGKKKRFPMLRKAFGFHD